MTGRWSLPAADSYFGPLLEREPRGFQIDHLDVALAHCQQFRVAVDGGAHIGTWSVELAKHFARVLAFEPAPDTYACLRDNTAALDNVTAFSSALGGGIGRGEMCDDARRAGNTGARYLQEASGGSVAVYPLDAFGLTDVDFLKIDVEGHELAVLRGSARTLRLSRPVVVIEVKPLRPGHDPMQAVLFLERIGYREVARAGRDRVFVS